MGEKLKKLPMGIDSFARLRTADYYYVDKTGMIRELLEDSCKVNLFTRPRRFGKSLNVDMLKTFFEIGTEPELFEGLTIWTCEDICDEYFAKYPVISLTLKDVEGEDHDMAYQALCSSVGIEVRRLCVKYGLLDSDLLLDTDKIFLKEVLAERYERGIAVCLRRVFELLAQVCGRQVILFVDEYDVPLDKARQNGYYDQMLGTIRNLLSTVLKSNSSLEFAVLTGCLRIAKESIFTGLNNFVVNSVSDEEYSAYFGFTDAEVRQMLAYYGLTERCEVIKEWYDGYVFGDSFVYCPWDVMNYLSALKKRQNAKPKNYWKNTSHNGVLLTFVKRTDFKVKGKFEILMNKGTIVQTVSDDLTYDTLHSSEDHLWSVLLMTGYLTKADEKEEGETVRLRIPNREIASIFEDTVVELFRQTIDNSARKSMMDALWNGDEQEASKVISDLLWRTISYNDYHEDYYHAFLAGVFVGLGYEVESNKEKGLGRPDILLKDDDNRRAMIIEAKRSMKEEDMDTIAEAITMVIKSKDNVEKARQLVKSLTDKYPLTL